MTRPAGALCYNPPATMDDPPPRPGSAPPAALHRPPSPPALHRRPTTVGDGAASLTAHQAGGLDLNPWLSLAVGVVLVLLNGFFVAAEFALVKVRPTQLDPHVARGLRRARAARHMLDHLDSYLSATQLGITLASLGLGWVGEPAFAWLVRPGGLAVRRLAGGGLDHFDRPRLPGHHHPPHRHRRAGAQVVRHPQGRGDDAVHRPAALGLLQAHLPGDLAAQPLRQRHPAADRGAAGGRGRAGARRGGAAPAARLRRPRPPLEAEARAARQHLRAVRPDGAPDHAAARRRRLPLHHPEPGGEPGHRPRERPHPLPALRRRPRPRGRPGPHQGPLPRRG